MVLSGRDAGFSLVELMVVLAIAGLAASAVVLSFSRGDGLARSEGQRLAARLGAARDAAVIGGQPMAVDVDPLGYAFSRRAGGVWAKPGEASLQARAWPAGLVIRLDGGRLDGGQDHRRVIFDGMGMASAAMTVQLAPQGRESVNRDWGGVAVVLARDGEVSLSGGSAP
ncbi:MAG TPA: type II secretion system protein GspH [Novosphingobium capsulatum]|nr:type II secretion system protein GspH [Novosphingobium capsulatum]